MDDGIRRQIQAQASRQRGLITRQQALAAGAQARTIERWLRAGAWPPIHPGVYIVGGAPRSWEQKALAATLSFSTTAVLSHHSAARIWAMDVRAVAWIDVTVERLHRSGRTISGVRIHRPRCLAKSQHAVLADMPVTSPARTLWDLAAVLAPAELLSVVDDAFARGLVTVPAMKRMLDVPAGGVPGVAGLRRACRPWLSGPAVDSVAEMRLLRLLRQSGLPAPDTRRPVHEGGRTFARLDLCWPERRLVVEVDGYRFHCSRQQFERDRERDLKLTLQGWHVIRCSAASLAMDPELVLAPLRRLLAA